MRCPSILKKLSHFFVIFPVNQKHIYYESFCLSEDMNIHLLFLEALWLAKVTYCGETIVAVSQYICNEPQHIVAFFQ